MSIRVQPKSSQSPKYPAVPQVAVEIPRPVMVAHPLRSEFVAPPRETVLGKADPSAKPLPTEPGVAPGPLDLKSAAAKKAIATARSAFTTKGIGASGELVAAGVEKDELGMTHVRLNRELDGLPIFGEQVIAHLGRDGKVASTTGSLAPLTVAPTLEGATLSADQAIAAATKAFGQENAGLAPNAPATQQRVWLRAKDGTLHKAYQVVLTNLSGGPQPLKMNYFVDAQSGQVLRKFNTIDAITAPKSDAQVGAEKPALKSSMVAPHAHETATATGGQRIAKGKGHSLYSGDVNLVTQKLADGTYILKDNARGGGEVWDAHNQNPAGGKSRFHDKDNLWGEKTDPKREKAAVDAEYGMEMTWDFYKGVLGRNSIDGKGEALNSYVHVGSNYVNAFWDGTTMNYGDGDGKDASPLTALDVAGHEISHGLTERTAGLIYDGESGSLNESMSDILGTGVEWYAAKRNKQVKWDYKIGEDVWTPGKKGDALRYMGDPTKDGYSLDNYKNFDPTTEVHSGSGISNNAFYLLSHGGKNRTSGQGVTGGIGMEKSLKIFSRALVYYMTPETTFADARKATIQAATDLYGAGSAEVAKLKQAWTAVGVK